MDPELTGEILKVIKDLAAEHITMVIVTHEMSFARDISDRIIFMDDGLIAVEGTPEEVFSSEHVRMKEFLGKFHQGLVYLSVLILSLLFLSKFLSFTLRINCFFPHTRGLYNIQRF